MTPPLRIGFVGHGRHARANLYPALARLGVPLASVATRHADTARAAALAVGAARAHDDHRRMLAEDALDAVFISAAPEDHARLAEDALRANAHVFVEKPLGLNADEARRVADLADARGRRVMVGFMKRFAPAYRRLAALVRDEAAFGRPVAYHATFAFAPWTDALRDEAFLRLGAIHHVDLARALLGEVEAAGGASGSRGADLALGFTLRFASGAVGTLHFAGGPAWAREHEAVTVTGTRAAASAVDLAEVRVHLAPPREADWTDLSQETRVFAASASPASGPWRDLHLRGFVGEVEHFLACVREDREPLASARDNVATTALLDRLVAALP